MANHIERRPLRFGVTAASAPSAAAWRDLALRTEDQGYSSLLLPDHANPQLAPIPALAVAAAVTTKLRVGTHVLDNDHRNPVILAKEVATLDLLSDGRSDWGMGAGWLPSDYEATGIAFDEPAVRLDRLIESVTVIRRILAGGPVDHEGGHYRVTGAKGSPLPVQRPHPPLLVGGSKPRLLRFAGSEADIVSISPSPSSRQFGPFPPTIGVEESMDHQVALVATAAAEAGRERTPELSVNVTPVPVAGDLAATAEEAGPRFGLSPEQVVVSPHVLMGSVDAVCEAVLARRDRWGITYWVVPSNHANAFAPVVARLAGT